MQIFSRVQIELLSRWCTCLLRVIIPLSRIITRVVNGWKGDGRLWISSEGRSFEYRSNILSEKSISPCFDNVQCSKFSPLSNIVILINIIRRAINHSSKIKISNEIRILIMILFYICLYSFEICSNSKRKQNYPKRSDYNWWRIFQQGSIDRDTFKVLT